MRFAKQRDKNEADIVKALQSVGAAVQRLNEPGVPDLLVSYRDQLWLLEVKNPSRKDGKAHSREGMGGAGELTPAQVRWWREWQESQGRAPRIVRSIGDALEAIGATARLENGNDAGVAVKQAGSSTAAMG